MNNLPPVITVDGPSGSGKGVLSKKLANVLQWNLLDSGIIYRVLALIALNSKIDVGNEIALANIASNIKINFVKKLDRYLVFFNKKEITQDIYKESIGNFASIIATLPKVREALLKYQRKFCTFPGLIADGRDMGTVIFPHAVLKIFLYASLEERKKRKLHTLKNIFFNVNCEKQYWILRMMQERDNRDCNRMIAPLLPADNALILDSTNLSQEETSIKVFAYIKKNLLLPSELLYKIHS